MPLQTPNLRKGTLLAPETQVRGGEKVSSNLWEGPSPFNPLHLGYAKCASAALIYLPSATEEEARSQNFFPHPSLPGVSKRGLHHDYLLMGECSV